MNGCKIILRHIYIFLYSASFYTLFYTIHAYKPTCIVNLYRQGKQEVIFSQMSFWPLHQLIFWIYYSEPYKTPNCPTPVCSFKLCARSPFSAPTKLCQQSIVYSKNWKSAICATSAQFEIWLNSPVIPLNVPWSLFPALTCFNVVHFYLKCTDSHLEVPFSATSS